MLGDEEYLSSSILAFGRQAQRPAPPPVALKIGFRSSQYLSPILEVNSGILADGDSPSLYRRSLDFSPSEQARSEDTEFLSDGEYQQARDHSVSDSVQCSDLQGGLSSRLFPQSGQFQDELPVLVEAPELFGAMTPHESPIRDLADLQ